MSNYLLIEEPNEPDFYSQEEFQAEQHALITGALLQVELTKDVPVAATLARTLYDAGLRVDGEALSDYAALEQVGQEIMQYEAEGIWADLTVLDDPLEYDGFNGDEGEIPAGLSAGILAAAQEERKRHLTELAAQSASQLIPNPHLHDRMNLLLEEIEENA